MIEPHTGKIDHIAELTSISAQTRSVRFFRRYFLAGTGGLLILFWIVIMLISPIIAPYSAVEVDVSNRLKSPSSEHWFGTDDLGRDVYSRTLMGSRISLPASFAVVLLAGIFGTLYGGIAAYARGRIEELMMRIADVVLSFPALILAMAIAAALGVGITNAILAIFIVWWPKYARLSRSLVIVERSKEYVQAAQVIGFRPTRILLKHIFPNALGPLIVLITLDLGNAIITFAGLSFLGLGVVPPHPEWGRMVADGRLLINQWWVSSFPGFAIFTVVMGFNFLGDGIRDWIDPKARKR
jgi:peptide/nickel transport system permease protein